jgi:hypothetical protein
MPFLAASVRRTNSIRISSAIGRTPEIIPDLHGLTGSGPIAPLPGLTDPPMQGVTSMDHSPTFPSNSSLIPTSRLLLMNYVCDMSFRRRPESSLVRALCPTLKLDTGLRRCDQPETKNVGTPILSKRSQIGLEVVSGALTRHNLTDPTVRWGHLTSPRKRSDRYITKPIWPPEEKVPRL